MNRLTLKALPLSGLRLVERSSVTDGRGALTRLFCAQELAQAGWRQPVAQINHSWTAKGGTVRGMHYQRSPHAEMKLVTCLRGAVWDVAVDLRAGSATFLQWHAEELSAINHRAMLIPEGFAHGFQTLADDCELIYLHSMAYVPDAEAGLNSRDPRLSIGWPLALTELSTKDAQYPYLDDKFSGVTL